MCIGVRGQQGRAGSLSPLHVSAGQTQAELAILSQQPLTQRQADAAAERQRHRERETDGKQTKLHRGAE